MDLGRRLIITSGVAALAALISFLVTGGDVKAKVTVNIPFIGQINLEADLAQRQAAWILYVELVTRIANQPLAPDRGLLREAFTSLYSLFGITREVLKQVGPSAGISRDSVGGIAIAFLNEGLRPFLAKWHPRLQSWEAKRPDNLSPLEHEQNWSENNQCRLELEQLRQDLQQYVEALAVIAKAGQK